MPSGHQIGEGTAYQEIMEGLGLPIAWGMEGELGAAMADKAIPHPSSAWTLSLLSNSEQNTAEALPLWYNVFLKFFSCCSLVI